MSPLRLASVPVAVVLALGTSTGCAAPGDHGKPQVVASFYPLQYVAQRVVGNHADVTNLTGPGVEPHDLDPTPRQTADISEASVVLFEKGLQPAVDAIVRNDPPKKVVDAASVVHLQQGDGGLDPHFWLDPTLLAKTVRPFSEAMQQADPDHAADYRINAAAVLKDLLTLDSEFEAGLAGCKIRTLVVSHDAFEYFGRRYGFTVSPIAGLSPDAEPSAKRLSELASLVGSKGVTTVFSERLASPRIADTLASEAGVRTEVLDPLEGLAKGSGGTYLSVMRHNLQVLRTAQECS